MLVRSAVLVVLMAVRQHTGVETLGYCRVPNFIKARATSQTNACINNLRQIDGAINEWALENGQSNGAAVANVNTVSSYIKLDHDGDVPACPAQGTYVTTTVGAAPQVSCTLSTLTPGYFLP